MDYVKLGRSIRHARFARHWPQARLAQEAGISLSFLGRIERGSRKTSLETVYKIAQILGLSLDEILLPDKDEKAQNTRQLAQAYEILQYTIQVLEKQR